MRRRDEPADSGSQHAEVWRILPWYVNGTLDEAERSTVSQHLRGCLLCREEVERSRELQAAIQSEEELSWYPEPQLSEIMARIENAADRRRSGRLSSFLQKVELGLREMIHVSPPLARWVLVTQMILIVTLVGFFVANRGDNSDSLYRTLSDRPAASAADTFRVRIVFSQDAQESEVRALLLELSGRIVDGPSPAGVYTVELAAHPESPDLLLEQLRSRHLVRFAEPFRYGSEED